MIVSDEENKNWAAKIIKIEREKKVPEEGARSLHGLIISGSVSG
jgi:hypothetical protein